MEFQRLTKSFGGHQVLRGVGEKICAGDVILLRGENGSGKTTLLNILTGCLEPDAGEITIHAAKSHAQSFSFPRPWLHDLNPFQRFTPEYVAKLGIGRTWQDVRLFSSLSLVDNIAAADPAAGDSPWSALFSPRALHRRESQHTAEASTRLNDLGLHQREASRADRISLGQSKRVAIARALQAGARVLFLDEPLAGLDADGIRDVLTHLRKLAVEQGIALVIIEHVLNIPHLLDFVTSVWTLKDGTLTTSSPNAIAQELASAGTATNIHSLIRQALDREVPVTTQSLPQGAKLTTYWLGDGEQSIAAVPVLEVENLTIQRGSRMLFAEQDQPSRGLSFRLHPQTLNILEAPNGWGKSSLFEVITGIQNARYKGAIKVQGTTIDRDDFSPFAFYNFGNRALPSSNNLFSSVTLKELERLTSLNLRIKDSNQKIGDLSGGQLRQLTMATLKDAVFLFFDEMLHSLDSKHISEYFSKNNPNFFSAKSILFLEPFRALNV